MPNRFGLSRTIPEDVRRTIRQRCGFGCVICGLGIVQYEHVDPEFRDAKRHDPDCMTLLCPQCHAKVTSRMWSKARVKLAMKSPRALQDGYSKEFFDFAHGAPVLRFGGNTLRNCPVPIQVNGRPLIGVRPPADDGEPFRLSGTFTNSAGAHTLSIIDNEWQASASNWDVEVAGPRITIRERQRSINLQIHVEAPNVLVVDRLDMSFGGFHFEGDSESLRVTVPGRGTQTFSGNLFDNNLVGMAFGAIRPNTGPLTP